MIIDLHVHTRAFSPCSNIDPEEAIQEARRVGLDALCFTEHNKLWKKEDIRDLGKKWGFPVFRGMEVETREGHMLVFGLKEEIDRLFSAAELKEIVDRAQGVIIAAHPFRGFLIFSFSSQTLTAEEASQRPYLQMVPAIETCSGKSTKKENELAAEVCRKLSARGVGGSDAHVLHEIGRCATTFERTVRSEDELINELKGGRFRAGYFRKGK